MTAAEGFWSVGLTATAEADFQNIIDWTLVQFGDQQARIYAETLSNALEPLTAGPTTIGVKERTDIAKGLFTLHVARAGRKEGTSSCFVSMPIDNAVGSKCCGYFMTPWICLTTPRAWLACNRPFGRRVPGLPPKRPEWAMEPRRAFRRH
jgi:plasmid stabilization system protein ParE